nr:reverse transcriptase domain-containing protein [Tanacetum cinerariifolium]
MVRLLLSSNGRREMEECLACPKGGSCGGKGGRGGSITERGGGWLAKRSIVSNDGRGGGGLVVIGGKSLRESKNGRAGNGEVKGSRVNLVEVNSLLVKILRDLMEERGGDMMRLGGGPVCNTQHNPKGSSSKPYQPPQARNEQVNVVFTQTGKSFDPSINPNDQPNDSKTPIIFDSDDEDEQPTPQPKPKDPKPTKENPTPKPYKPKILYPQCLRKEKIEPQYGKFLDMIQSVRINVPLVKVLAGMPNYGKFLKELVSNKNKLKQISSAFLSNESSTLI